MIFFEKYLEKTFFCFYLCSTEKEIKSSSKKILKFLLNISKNNFKKF